MVRGFYRGVAALALVLWAAGASAQERSAMPLNGLGATSAAFAAIAAAAGNSLPNLTLTNPGTTAARNLTLSGANTSAGIFGVNGMQATFGGAVYTDTTASGTVTNVFDAVIGQPTFAASSATTITNAATLRINGPPIAGANMSFTNPYALMVNGGNTLLNGNATIGSALTVSGTTPSTSTTTGAITDAGGLGVVGAGYFGGQVYSNNAAVSETLVSTLTASSSASLAWTGLTGGDYRLVCRNVVPATNASAAYIQFGEGSTPTWETSGYQWSRAAQTTANGAANSGTISDSGIGGPTSLANSGLGVGFSFNLRSLSSSITHSADGTLGYNNTVPAYAFGSFGGLYTTDTNPITAVRVIMSSGNITSGSCSLYQVQS